MNRATAAIGASKSEISRKATIADSHFNRSTSPGVHENDLFGRENWKGLKIKRTVTAFIYRCGTQVSVNCSVVTGGAFLLPICALQLPRPCPLHRFSINLMNIAGPQADFTYATQQPPSLPNNSHHHCVACHIFQHRSGPR